MSGTNFFPPNGSVRVAQTDEYGNAMFGECTVALLPSAVAGYAIGCELVATDTGAHYYNLGTAASCTFSLAGTVAAGSVTATELASNAVTTIKIADNAVTGAKIALASQAAGDIMYYDGTDWIRLAKGAAGEVLTMNAGATAPEWA